METGMLHLHSVLRYLIIIVGLWTVLTMASGLNGKKPFTKATKRPALFFLILMDLQLLVGLFLYFVGPWGYQVLKSYGIERVMQSKMPRFFAVEHGVGMLLAVILVHVGYAFTKKNMDPKRKFNRAFWMFLIAFLIILSFIPWPFFKELGRGWMPG